MRVEWDENKNIININKHGIDFITAAEVFFDDQRIEIFDSFHSLEEDRYITIGSIGDIVFVVYTERSEVIRLISARLATREERDMYYDKRC